MYVSLFWCRIIGITLACYCCTTLPGYGQRPENWPRAVGGTPNHVNNYNNAEVRYGYVVLKTGDTLRGTVKIFPYLAYPGILVWREGDPSPRQIRLIGWREIHCARTYPDPGRPDSGHTDFVNLHDKDLWRKLASTDSLTIYDDNTPNFNTRPFGNEMILVGPDRKWVRIYHDNYRDFDAEVVPLILQFINNRYNVQVQPGDFKDAWALIRYILDKEAEHAG